MSAIVRNAASACAAHIQASAAEVTVPESEAEASPESAGENTPRCAACNDAGAVTEAEEAIPSPENDQ